MALAEDGTGQTVLHWAAGGRGAKREVILLALSDLIAVESCRYISKYVHIDMHSQADG